MGNTCSFTGTRRNNRVLPTNSTVLALGLRNKDIASYRRHKKRCEAQNGSPVASGSSTGAKEISKGESLTQEESCSNSQECKQDKEMKEWLSSIFTQNNLLPSYITFDNKRHLSMRSQYADIIQIINLSKVIHETQEDEVDQTISLEQPRNRNLLKNATLGIKKSLSSETYSLGLGPALKMSTRISKDAVKRNRQKDSQLAFQGGKSPPPPPKSLASGTGGSNAVILKSHDSKDSRESQKAGSSADSEKHFHVSSNWLDEDFEENILSYHQETPKVKDIPQCSKLPPNLHQEDHGKKQKSIKFKIEPEISEPAVHNLGLFLSAVEEDQSELKSTTGFFHIFKKKNRTSASYTADESPLCDDSSGS